MISHIAEAARRDGGATIDWSDQQVINNDDAWYFPAQPDATQVVDDENLLRALIDFTQRHEGRLKEADRYLGVWRDPQTNKYHIDINIRIKNQAKAKLLAKKLSKESSYTIKSIYNLRRDKAIDIDT